MNQQMIQKDKEERTVNSQSSGTSFKTGTCANNIDLLLRTGPGLVTLFSRNILLRPLNAFEFEV
jgi:hypothetical protein